MLDGLRPLASSRRCDVAGLPAMWFLRFADGDDERRFLLGLVERGVLLKRGAYNFPSLAHGDPEVAATLEAVAAALETGPAAPGAGPAAPGERTT
jgi:hypothetical protein